MKEILFRGKRKDIGVWENGYYCRHERRQVCPIDDKLREDEIQHLIIYDEFADWNMPKRLSAVEVLPETVGQFTGLSDKNGKRIFEGDIVKVKAWHVVVFENGAFALKAYNKCQPIPLLGHMNFHGIMRDIEVIGNIHDNPELLEVEA